MRKVSEKLLTKWKQMYVKNNSENILFHAPADIHDRNVKAGWWTDLKTGLSTLATRSRPELLILVVSEISEADGGFMANLNDDKLEHLPMFNVEIADVAIRLFDMIGAEDSYYEGRVDFEFNANVQNYVNTYKDLSHERQMLGIVNRISAGLEHLRKQRVAEYRTELCKALALTFAVSQIRLFDIIDVINQKIAFNATRPDHKIENRIKSDGKKF